MKRMNRSEIDNKNPETDNKKSETENPETADSNENQVTETPNLKPEPNEIVVNHYCPQNECDNDY